MTLCIGDLQFGIFLPRDHLSGRDRPTKTQYTCRVNKLTSLTIVSGFASGKNLFFFFLPISVTLSISLLFTFDHHGGAYHRLTDIFA